MGIAINPQKIQAENDLKFQTTIELCKTSKVNILKEVKTRDYKERPWFSASSNFKYFRCSPKIHQQPVVWYLRSSMKVLCLQNSHSQVTNCFQKKKSITCFSEILIFFSFLLFSSFVLCLTRAESYYSSWKCLARKNTLNKVWSDFT